MLCNFGKTLFFLITLSACSDQQNLQTYQLSGETMGTSYNITVVGEAYIEPTIITAALEDIENTMSTYRPDSELMRLNTAPLNTWINISPALYEVLEISQSVSFLTEGSFDITIAPLVNLWGFGPDENNVGSLPNENDIQALMENIGFQHLILAEDRIAILKTKMLNLDLSAVAKGYAVDVIAALLSTNNISNYLVEIGGEINSKGRNAQGEFWRIAIETPERSAITRNTIRTIQINDQSVASSGDYRNYYELDGVYYSHTIDPRSGRPVNHTLASVTVIAETAAIADALATAFNVMGTEQAIIIADNNNIPAYFLENTADGFIERYSAAFARYIDQ
ncbi:FAD:protein FMN transferase [Haliea sp. AH-315-K21]|nr:FAD:protein FMN transferase [Haliea sp. AH-315-K21]